MARDRMPRIRLNLTASMSKLVSDGSVAVLTDRPVSKNSKVAIGRLVCTVADVVPATDENIDRLVRMSGYGTTAEWLGHYPGRRPKYILVVRLGLQ